MLQKIWNTAITQVTTTPVEGNVGQLRVEPDGRIYRYVQNLHSAALGIGEFACGSTTDVLLGLAYQAGAANTDISIFLGVPLASIPANSYGWLQCRGRGVASVNGTTTTLALGNAIVPASGSLVGVRSTTGAVIPAGGYVMSLNAATITTTQVTTVVLINALV